MKPRALVTLSAVLIHAAFSSGCAETSGGELAKVPSATYTTIVNNVGAPYDGRLPATADLAPVGELAPERAALPATCAEAKAANPSAGDGEYMLGLRGHRVVVYCRGMAGTPTEYLTLPHTSGGANTSRYGRGPNTAQGGLTTSYAKVRFYPETLVVDWKDDTFASSAGWNAFGESRNTMWGWGNAGDCVAGHSATGTATIDLRGTPFAVASGQFSTEGFNPAGTVAYGELRQMVTLTGGGYCGNTGPKGPRVQLTWLDT
jgi:hypothetical protein